MNFSTKAGLRVNLAGQYCKETYGSVENLITEAKNGNVTAQADLGMAYSEGIEGFVEMDSEKAIGWLNAAIDNGFVHPLMLTKYGELLDLKGTPQKKRKAYEMYHRAAELGSPAAQLNLAEMYRCGVEGVVNEDIKEAFEWYKRAADESTGDDNTEVGTTGRLFAGTMKAVDGNGAKQQALKRMYLNYFDGDCPEGRPQPTKGVYYLTRAAELGDTEAQLELGKIYLNGSCEQIKDVKRARRWLGKAAASGDVIAKQLLQQCKQTDDTQHDASEVSEEAWIQSFSLMEEKLTQRAEANVNPLVITQPVAFSEEMLRQYGWSRTARIYLQAYQLVKKGLEILDKSNFADGRGVSFIAHGYLTENSILQAFPEIQNSLSPNIVQLCEENLSKNPCFFEGLLLCYVLHGFERTVSEESMKHDAEKVMCIKNLCHFIQKAEPESLPSDDPFKFDENYSSWLHVLFYHLGAIYTIAGANELAAEAFENSLKHCPSYFESKRALGYNLMELYEISIKKSERLESSQVSCTEFSPYEQSLLGRHMSKYASWPTEKLGDTAEKVLKEYLAEAPRCYKTYPNVCYYLANLALIKNNKTEFNEYYEFGQDAEEKRLPFFEAVNIPLKDVISHFYQLFANVREPARCGNRTCIKIVQESELKTCGQCGNQKYCSKDCQKEDWRNHKSTCTASKGPRAKHGS